MPVTTTTVPGRNVGTYIVTGIIGTVNDGGPFRGLLEADEVS
jgi:hypothetical protein